MIGLGREDHYLAPCCLQPLETAIDCGCLGSPFLGKRPFQGAFCIVVATGIQNEYLGFASQCERVHHFVERDYFKRDDVRILEGRVDRNEHVLPFPLHAVSRVVEQCDIRVTRLPRELGNHGAELNNIDVFGSDDFEANVLQCCCDVIGVIGRVL